MDGYVFLFFGFSTKNKKRSNLCELCASAVKCLTAQVEILTVVLKHCPLPPVSIPGFDLTFAQGIRAVVSVIIVKIAEMLAGGAMNQVARVRFHFLVTSIIHYISSYLMVS